MVCQKVWIGKRHNKTVIAYYKADFKISYFYFSSRIRRISLRSVSYPVFAGLRYAQLPTLHFALSTFLKRGPPGKEAPLRFTTSKKVF
jgi:hypothetical protein